MVRAMPDYVIHIGPPKTATTYLQRNFTRLAGTLRAEGILYPLDLGTPGHVKLARDLAAPDAVARLTPVFAALHDSGARLVLLSAEDLAPLRRPHLEALRTLIGNHDVTIVYYCRRWSEMVRSRWGERVKHGSHDTLQQYCASAVATPLRTSAVNYGLTLKRWARVFGAMSLRLVALNALGETDTEIATHFLQTFLGLDIHIPPPPQRENRSMPLVETEILRALNAIDWETYQRRSSALRKSFIQQRDSLDFTHTEAAIAANLTEVIFDETRPLLLHLHKSLFAQYQINLVPPHQNGLFFEPKRSILKAAAPDFLNDPAVAAELAEAYGVLGVP